MEEKVEKNEEKIYIPFQHSVDDLFLKPEDLKFHDKGESLFAQKKKKSINRNYDFLFSEEKDDRIDRLVYRFYSQLTSKGINIKAISTHLRLIFIEKVRKIYTYEYTIWEAIHYLTSNVGINNQQKILENLKTIVEDVKENNGIICIKTTFGEIKFSRITNFFPNLEFDDEIEDIRNRLGKIGEVGKCHAWAIEYSKRLKNIGIENDVVTADKYLMTDKNKHLHSWNEFEINGKEHVLDYTQNVVMNKDGYYALNHIKKVISKINCMDIENDEKLYRQINGRYYEIDAKTYLTCRDEIMRDLQKNIGIFNEER